MIAFRGKKLVALALTDNGESSEVHDARREIYDEMSQPPTSSTMEHCEISLHPWPSSQSAAGFQQSVSSAVNQDGILQHPQPSTSSTLTHIPQNDPLSSVASRHAYYSSSSESEPFQDSGESYVPSEDEQDSLSEDEQST
ncbi:unnamed protein product [Acanthoscelides obtectus]|uniref:Uncharacterized protein n=1 Tax=Acanthoscelides obtectus TaxID=200917 RepID=A0A9P0LUJ8_ACAOB|nr:unnamed protein product [Acanthoscelides obtectus]CAK1651337.1 hypothetical protein AOBTE_LOCUS17198 [Acanthoscelides obtectus]